MAEPSSPVDELRSSLALLWGATAPPTRGPRPGLTVERIVDAAIALADTDGLAALSMRNLAAALGVGTMTLYRYVPGRAELVALMVDTVSGEGLDDPPVEGGWRERVTAAALGEWALYRRHPWLLTIEQGRPMLGPRAMRATERALADLDGTGLGVRQRMSVVMLVSSFVSGLARSAAEQARAAAVTGISDEEWWAAHGEFLADSAERQPLLWAAGEAGAWNDGEEETDLRFGLAAILDGIAARIAAG
jgi:AcrR family transcriptional regulator